MNLIWTPSKVGFFLLFFVLFFFGGGGGVGVGVCSAVPAVFLVTRLKACYLHQLNQPEFCITDKYRSGDRKLTIDIFAYYPIIIHWSKYVRDQIFKAIYWEIYWEKSFQIVVLFTCNWIIALDNAVVAKEKLAKLYFLHNPEGNRPQNTSVSDPLRSWPLPFQTRSNTITLSIFKSVAGMATDLTLNYSNFAPLNVWSFAPLDVCIMLR